MAASCSFVLVDKPALTAPTDAPRSCSSMVVPTADGLGAAGLFGGSIFALRDGADRSSLGAAPLMVRGPAHSMNAT